MKGVNAADDGLYHMVMMAWAAKEYGVCIALEGTA